VARAVKGVSYRSLAALWTTLPAVPMFRKFSKIERNSMKALLHTLAFPTVAACFSALAASGAVVTFDFTGSVHNVYNPYGVVSPSLVRVGDPVSVSLRYDTTTLDGYPEDPTRGRFFSPGWLKVNINGLAFECTNRALIDIIHTGASGGQEFFQALPYGNQTVWPAELPDYPNKGFGFACWETGPAYDFLSNAELPLALDFSRAEIRNGGIQTGTDTLNMYEIQFNLVQVPEPSATVLLLAGISLGVGMQRHRRQMGND
jgi:hypothetical protein